jgi:hypothetical protein
MGPFTSIRAALALAALAAPALAQSTPGGASYAVVASAPRVCSIAQPRLEPGRLVNFRTLNGTTLTVDRLTDPATLATLAASASIGFEAVCNFPHQVVIESQNNGLWRSALTRTPEGFADAVPYGATLRWGDLTRRLEIDAENRRIVEFAVPVGKPTAGTLQLDIDIQAGAANLRTQAPLLAGVYQDTLRVTVEPQ